MHKVEGGVGDGYRGRPVNTEETKHYFENKFRAG
jgi:hypothetical protein